MKISRKLIGLSVSVALVISTFSLPTISLASGVYSTGYYEDEIQRKTDPTGAAMVVDAVFARPMSAVGFVVGTGVFLVMLPFSLLGGNVVGSAEKLVGHPFQSTFMRCLGCEVEYN